MIKIDTSQLTAAFQDYAKATEKDMAAIVNRAGRNIAIKTVKLLPQASPGAIASDLNTILTVGDGQGGRKLRTKRKNQSARKYVLVMSRARKKGKKLTKSETGGKVSALQRARKGSKGYTKLCVMTAGKPFGAFTQARVRKGLGSKSTGKKAKPGPVPEATLTMVLQKGADEVVSPALQGALGEVATDMSDYARDLLEKTAKKYAGQTR